MPKKYEHVVMCRLSKRQRYLYDDFMGRVNTRETLASGNLLSVINVLMQLRKVCNHPNMFETRPTVSPFRMDAINMHMPSIVTKLFDYDPFTQIDLSSLNLQLAQLELSLSAYTAYYAHKTQAPRKLIEELDSTPAPPPQCPEGQFKMFMRIKEANVSNNICSYSSGVRVGTSPAMKTEGTKIVPVNNNLLLGSTNKGYRKTIEVNPSLTIAGNHSIRSGGTSVNAIAMPSISATMPITQAQVVGINKRIDPTWRKADVNSINIDARNRAMTTTQFFQGGRQIILAQSNNGTMVTPSGHRVTVLRSTVPLQHHPQHQQQQQQKMVRAPMARTTRIVTTAAAASTLPVIATSNSVCRDPKLINEMAKQLKAHSYALATDTAHKPVTTFTGIVAESDNEFEMVDTKELLKLQMKHRLRLMARVNRRRCSAAPVYGTDLRDSMTKLFNASERSPELLSWHSKGFVTCLNVMQSRNNWSLESCLRTIEQRTADMKDIFANFILFVPPVSAPQPSYYVSHPTPSVIHRQRINERIMTAELLPKLTLLHPIVSAMSTQFPDPRLIQYDCGKLQTLNRLLRQLKDQQHRVLIFTQMTRMLDVLEAFLNCHGHIYLRLDGSTKVEQRQILMDRFNNDKRIFAFILSTRSGGVGINLTGADTVIFYDSDWNPTMDAQAQDRCHRIGQTRDVHIYRLVSEKTIEENILKKANQKRLLGDLAIEGGNFTTAYFKGSSIQELFNVNNAEDNASNRLAEVLDRDRERRARLQENLVVQPSTSTATSTDDRSAIGAFESALAAAEDEQDVQAAKIASAEAAADLAEFDESIPIEDNENKPPELSKAEQEVENLVKQVCICCVFIFSLGSISIEIVFQII